MKKQFSHRPNSSYVSHGYRPAATVPIWVYGAAVGVVLIILGVRVFLPGVFVTLVSPAWRLGTSLSAGVGNSVDGLATKQQLMAENTNLTVEVNTLRSENAVLTARSQDLTKLLGGETNQSDTLLAGVLARPPESPYDELVVAAGVADGVKNGAEVYSSGGTPIGTVQQTNTHSAYVSLFSTAGRKTSGWIGANRIPVILNGTGAGSFDAVLSASSTIIVGDSVYVPGPGALPVGTVIRVDSDPSSPVPVIHIQPLVNIFSVTWVEISRSVTL